VVVDQQPLAVMAGTYGRKKGRRGNYSDHAGRLGSGWLTPIDPSDSDRDEGRIGPADSVWLRCHRVGGGFTEMGGGFTEKA
jgi:hypothetical protein